MKNIDQQLEALVRDLPDEEGARLFFDRLSREHARDAERLSRNEGQFSDALALAAWSPLLATTLSQNPEYLTWLGRERSQTRVRTREELGESLARFGLTNSQLDPHVLLARFRRRELLRTYLHDIRRTSSLVEITEELSNLADAILEHALSLARQELDNRYGPPQNTDARGRVTAAKLSIVALGKLGSRDLNYASDIDLLFLYSDDGTTSGKGTRGEITNREYFVRLAETVSRMVGQQKGEGAAYRVDLRLRPHGRDGALASSLAEAIAYYRQTAQPWERQALIRSRASAGSAQLFTKFADGVRESVYAPNVTVGAALRDVRLSKLKIDRQHAYDTRGYNVKLGQGGIREIEFIAQALQLAFGGGDEWLRAPHTFISLGRLADRRLILERERIELSEAYEFLRTVEHRIQMENGLQAHSVPDDSVRREILARRMGFGGKRALEEFDKALTTHTSHVRAAYDRVFGATEALGEPEALEDSIALHFDRRGEFSEPPDSENEAVHAAAIVFSRYMRGNADETNVIKLAQKLRECSAGSLNPSRALKYISLIAASLDKSNSSLTLNTTTLSSLSSICGSSEFFGEMIAGHPSLVSATDGEDVDVDEYRKLLVNAVESEKSYRAALIALRQAWSRLLVRIGVLDSSSLISMREANRRQSLLAAASIDAANIVALRELENRYGRFDAEPRLAVLGVGRLGGGGMDYGSDLDVVLVYDEDHASPVSSLDHAEFYSRLSELLVAALSSLTREGYLYRVDLRLRPDGKNGPTCIGSGAFISYLRDRAVPWEWLAYVKLRAVAGDITLGERVELDAREVIHRVALVIENEKLRVETRHIRDRLESERSKRRRGEGIDIKFGRGGMLDVYFATRFLQLRDNIPDESDDRSTINTLAVLHARNSLNEEDFDAMDSGYEFLRALDHAMRLVVGRSTRLPVSEHPSLVDIARRLAYQSPDALESDVVKHMANIRRAYDRVTENADV